MKERLHFDVIAKWGILFFYHKYIENVNSYCPEKCQNGTNSHPRFAKPHGFLKHNKLSNYTPNYYTRIHTFFVFLKYFKYAIYNHV